MINQPTSNATTWRVHAIAPTGRLVVELDACSPAEALRIAAEQVAATGFFAPDVYAITLSACDVGVALVVDADGEAVGDLEGTL